MLKLILNAVLKLSILAVVSVVLVACMIVFLDDARQLQRDEQAFKSWLHGE